MYVFKMVKRAATEQKYAISASGEYLLIKKIVKIVRLHTGVVKLANETRCI